MASVPIEIHVHLSIAEAAALMAENDIGASPVLLDNSARDLAGIISERDIVRSSPTTATQTTSGSAIG
ncbi:MAG: CBS domain-containing protein [Acidimicrobiales bacterium]